MRPAAPTAADTAVGTLDENGLPVRIVLTTIVGPDTRLRRPGVSQLPMLCVPCRGHKLNRPDRDTRPSSDPSHNAELRYAAILTSEGGLNAAFPVVTLTSIRHRHVRNDVTASNMRTASWNTGSTPDAASVHRMTGGGVCAVANAITSASNAASADPCCARQYRQVPGAPASPRHVTLPRPRPPLRRGSRMIPQTRCNGQVWRASHQFDPSVPVKIAKRICQIQGGAPGSTQ